MDYSSWNVPVQTISFLEADLMIVISVLFVLGFILIVRYGAKILPAVVGAVSYLVFAFLGTESFCMLFSVIPGINSIMYANAVVYSVFRSVILALMYHAARYLAIRLTSKADYTLGNSMMAGFGNAFGFAIVSGFNYMYSSVIGKTINELGMDAMLEGCTAEEIDSMVQTFGNLVNKPSALFLMLGIGTAVDMIFMILICVFVYAILQKKLPAKYHAAVILANVGVLLPTVLLECYSVDQYVLMTVIKLAVLVLTFWAMQYVDRRYLNREFATAGSSDYKTATHLPRMKKK